MRPRRRLTTILLFASLLIGAQGQLAQERAFFGNLHSHTSYSDGTGRPRDAYRYARDVAKIDFLALTEHNHAEALGSDGIGIATSNALYKGGQSSSLISSARSFTENGRFVALYGQEFSTISSGNHVNVFDIGEVIGVDKGRFDLLLDFLQANRDSTGDLAILMLNHPKKSSGVLPTEYGIDDFATQSVWTEKMGRHARLIQMINGPGQDVGTNLPAAEPNETAFLKFLNLGFKLAPTADQDNHEANWGNATSARTAVLATELTKLKVLEALRNRHVYATEDKNLSVVIKVNGRLFGDVIAPLPSPSELSIEYSINDPDEPAAEYEIEVWRDAVGGETARIVSAVTVGAGNGLIEDVAFSGEAQYFFFKITQIDENGDEDTVWTAPVWFEASGLGPSLNDPGEADGSRFVASKKSEIYHVSDECRDAKRIKQANRVTGRAASLGRSLHEACPRTDTH